MAQGNENLVKGLEIMRKTTIGLVALGLLGASVSAQAATCISSSITDPGSSRTWTLDVTNAATDCVTGEGNPDAADVADWLGGTWNNRGELTGNGTNSLLSAAVTSGSWGSAPVSGTWAIDSSFWTLYADAVISFHMGGGTPKDVGDFALFLVKDFETSGTWSFSQVQMNGGGLSNIKLWSRGTPTSSGGTSSGDVPSSSSGNDVPEPASSLVLLGLGLLGLGFMRRAKLSA